MIEVGPRPSQARSKRLPFAALDGRGSGSSSSSLRSLPGGGWFAAIAIAMGWVFLALCLSASDIRAEHKDDGSDSDRRPKTSWDDLRAERQGGEGSDRSARDRGDGYRNGHRASDGDREHPRRRRMRALRKALPEFSRVERKLILRRARELPNAEREALRQRVSRIDQLEPTERKALESELRGMIADQPEERQRLEENMRRWEKMSDSERDEMRKQMRRFRELPVDKRREMLDQWSPDGRGSDRHHKERKRREERDAERESRGSDE